MERMITRRRLTSSSLPAAGLAVAGSLSTGPRVFAQSATPAATPAAPVPPVPPEFQDEVTNWPVEGGNLAQTREALNSSISSQTVGQLGLAWSKEISVEATFGSLTANPVVVGNLVYLQDAQSNVYAFDKASGDLKWEKKYNQAVPTGGPNGIAIGYGYAVYAVGGKGEVVAIDADTGDDKWSVFIAGPLGEGIDMAPAIHNNTVYVSTIPGNVDGYYQGGQRGVIHALDLTTGKVIWYFDTTTGNLWGNARVNSGGGLWHPPSIDADGYLYVGTGNASPYPGTKEFPGASSRPGPNDYASCLIRIDPATANVDWYINVKPHDLFDHDNQLTPVLGTVSIDGADVPAVFSSGKHGWVVAANQQTGEELWRTAVGRHNEFEFLSDLDAETTIDVLPGFLGGVETPMAFANGVVFAPAVNLAFTTNGVEGNPKGGNLFSGTGSLVALDGATGKILWEKEIPTLILGGATVANDVVFTGGLDGLVRGFNVEDGSQVFTYQTTGGINTSFAISGDYLYVPAGGPLVPSSDNTSSAPKSASQFVALKIGGEVQATPDATPAS